MRDYQVGLGLFFREARQEVAKRNLARQCRGVLALEPAFLNSHRQRLAIAVDLPSPKLEAVATRFGQDDGVSVT
jgi:hypothetical protein